MISSERASQEEQIGASFSSVAPSSEELWLRMLASRSNLFVRIRCSTGGVDVSLSNSKSETTPTKKTIVPRP